MVAAPRSWCKSSSATNDRSWAHRTRAACSTQLPPGTQQTKTNTGSLASGTAGTAAFVGQRTVRHCTQERRPWLSGMDVPGVPRPFPGGNNVRRPACSRKSSSRRYFHRTPSYSGRCASRGREGSRSSSRSTPSDNGLKVHQQPPGCTGESRITPSAAAEQPPYATSSRDMEIPTGRGRKRSTWAFPATGKPVKSGRTSGCGHVPVGNRPRIRSASGDQDRRLD